MFSDDYCFLTIKMYDKENNYGEDDVCLDKHNGSIYVVSNGNFVKWLNIGYKTDRKSVV